MTQLEMAKEVAKKTKLHFGDVCDVIEAYENILMKVIATEDYYQIGDIGVLMGVTKWPQEINTPVWNWKQKKKREEKKGWTKAKKGYPKMEFTRDAKMCIQIFAEDFFSEPPVRYCSAARKFRQSQGMPEIPEYDGLPEEKIQKYCQTIDEQLLPNWQFRTERDKEKMRDRIGYVAPSVAKKEELYDQWLIEEDKQKQRDAGVPENEIVERDIRVIKEERKFRITEEAVQNMTGNPDLHIVQEMPEGYYPDDDDYVPLTEEQKNDLEHYLDKSKAKRMRPKYGKKVLGKME